MANKKSKAERMESMKRIVCLALAILMIGSVVLAAALAQMF